MARLRVPPGRGGRLSLQHRLTVARRGADLLDRKLRILHAEAHRLAQVAERTGAAWTAAAGEADTWLLRAVLVGGERAIRLATGPDAADVVVSWAQTMGVRYPSEASCTVPAGPPSGVPTTGAAVQAARRAHVRAVEAAVRHAAADAALRVVTAEEAATRRRLRALNHRWIPLLTDALAAAQLLLDEQEREDDIRLRWAHGDHGA
ncbi:MAG: V-type ATP synthase subunit D [Nocardioidaceae bacterium]